MGGSGCSENESCCIVLYLLEFRKKIQTRITVSHKLAYIKMAEAEINATEKKKKKNSSFGQTCVG